MVVSNQHGQRHQRVKTCHQPHHMSHVVEVFIYMHKFYRVFFITSWKPQTSWVSLFAISYRLMKSQRACLRTQCKYFMVNKIVKNYLRKSQVLSEINKLFTILQHKTAVSNALQAKVVSTERGKCLLLCHIVHFNIKYLWRLPFIDT